MRLFRTVFENLKFHSNARFVYRWFSVLSFVCCLFFGCLGAYGFTKVSIFGEPGLWMILGSMISIFYMCFAFVCGWLAVKGWFDLTKKGVHDERGCRG